MKIQTYESSDDFVIKIKTKSDTLEAVELTSCTNVISIDWLIGVSNESWYSQSTNECAYYWFSRENSNHCNDFIKFKSKTKTKRRSNSITICSHTAQCLLWTLNANGNVQCALQADTADRATLLSCPHDNFAKNDFGFFQTFDSSREIAVA